MQGVTQPLPHKKMTRPTLKQIGSCLRPIGLYQCKVRNVDWSHCGYEPFDELFVEPRSRCRLDHYGNNGEGWDDSWYDEYAYPMEERARILIQDRFGEEILNRLNVEVGEKGFIVVHFLAGLLLLDDRNGRRLED